MRGLAESVALATLLATVAAAWGAGCRDWDRYEVVAAGGASTGGSDGGTGALGGAGGAGNGGSGGGVGGGGTGGVGGHGGAAPCGTIDLLGDEFEAASFDWRWDPDSYLTLVGGDLVMTYPPVQDGFQVESTAGFDFRGRWVAMELAEPPPADAGVWFNVARTPSNYLEFYLDGEGILHYAFEADGDYTTFATDTFDAVAHRFWRFREQTGTVFFEVSSDGADWNEVADFELEGLIDPAFTSVYVGGSTDTAGVSGQARVARIFTADEPGGLCGAASFSDDFDDPASYSAWTGGWEALECPIEHSMGVLRISCIPNAMEDSAFRSTSAYDFTASSVTVEIVSYPDVGSGAFMALAVARPEVESLWAFEIDEGELALYEAIEGKWNLVASDVYQPDTGRYLRIREAGGQVYFEQSSDGTVFDEFTQRTPPFDIREVEVVLAAGGDDNTAAVEMVFDDFNVVR